MKRKSGSTREEIAAYDENIVLWDDCDEAIVGIGERCGQPSVAIYDNGKLIECFVRQGMTHEEAEEWVDFNIRCAWVGERTPIILYTEPEL